MGLELVSKTIMGKDNILMVQCDLTMDTGETISKVLSFPDYLRLLESNCVPVIQDSYQVIGKLPMGYYNGSLCSNGNFRVIVNYPASMQPFFYEDFCVEIPFPNLVFFFECSKNQIVEKKCFAYKGSLCDDSTLYKYPFSNVQGKSGDICFGSIPLNDITSLAQIDEVVKSFFMGKSNGDYYRTSETVSVSYSLPELVQHLAKKKSFPEHYLMETSVTMKNILEEL